MADIEVPGETTDASTTSTTDTSAASSDDVAALKAQIAALETQLAAAKDKPTGIYEPVTPKGAEKLGSSAYASMSVAQLMAKIDSGEVSEPPGGVLCGDGWYAPRNSRG